MNAQQHPDLFPTYSSVTQQTVESHHLNWQGHLKEEFALHCSIATGLKSIKDEILKGLYVMDGNGIITVFLNAC